MTQTDSLDKSVQVSTSYKISDDQAKWQTKAYRKARQVNMVKAMLPYVESQSREYLYILRAGFCNSIIKQVGDKIQTSYCNTRFCTTCERIRKAKRIDSYLKPISEIDEPYFVTLTVKAVKIEHLKTTLEDMKVVWRKSRKAFSRKGLKTNGMKTIEFNYNVKTKTFNPHFHVIINTYENAQLLRQFWLKHNSNLSLMAQDIRPIKKNDKNTLFEIFAYTTKTINKGKIYPKILAQSVHALMDIRTLQSFGNVRKHNDDIEELEASALSFKPITLMDIEWKWDNEFKDWRFEDELLSEIQWSKKDIEDINVFHL